MRRGASRTAAALLVVLLAAAATAGAATIFDGDPVDPGSGRPYVVLPGVPLILPQPASGRYRPPIVDTSVVGDVDLVVRAGTLGIGPLMPPPVATPPVAVAGGVRVAAGTEIPFTVIASDGGPGLGAPLGGASLDGIPVVVAAFADLDGDGFVGPTRADPAGAADDARELQEAAFLVGRQIAVFSGGVAQGTVAVWKGAPASAGGLRVVLTAMAYVGPFDPQFFAGGVPDGPAVATLLPAFLDPDPSRTIDGRGPVGPEGRMGFVFEPAFDVPVDDPVLGTPFALPTDGSSPTIDRAVVVAGPVSAARFVQPAGLAGFSAEVEAPLLVGAGGALLEPRPAAEVADDGPGNGTQVQLVPVDALGNVTDAGTAVTLIAGPGIAIATPDADGDPTRETVALDTAAGVDLTLDDTGGAGDSGGVSTLSVVRGGVPVERLAVQLTGGGGGSGVPVVRGATILGQPAVLVRGCRVRTVLAAVVDPGGASAPAVSAALAVGGAPIATRPLHPASLPAGTPLPAGPGYRALLRLRSPPAGLLEITVGAESAAGSAVPLVLALPLVDPTPPTVLAPTVAPDTVPAGVRTPVTVRVRVHDDCGVRSVQALADQGRGFRRAGRLRDNGRRDDAVAGDGLYTGTLKLKPTHPGTIPIRVVARSRMRLEAVAPDVLVTVP
jgi:hypothetical protein